MSPAATESITLSQCHFNVTDAIAHAEGWSPIITAVLLLLMLDELKLQQRVEDYRLVDNPYVSAAVYQSLTSLFYRSCTKKKVYFYYCKHFLQWQSKQTYYVCHQLWCFSNVTGLSPLPSLRGLIFCKVLCVQWHKLISTEVKSQRGSDFVVSDVSESHHSPGRLKENATVYSRSVWSGEDLSVSCLSYWWTGQ